MQSNHMIYLIKYYEESDKVKGFKLQFVRRQYELLIMEKNEIVTFYASKIQGLIHMMKSFDEVMNEETMIEKVMRTLTPHFYHVIVAIQEFFILLTMEMNNIIGSLEARELRTLERKGVQESTQALQTQTFNKNGGFERHKLKKIKINSRSVHVKAPKNTNLDGKSKSFNKGEGTSNLN